MKRVRDLLWLFLAGFLVGVAAINTVICGLAVFELKSGFFGFFSALPVLAWLGFLWAVAIEAVRDQFR